MAPLDHLTGRGYVPRPVPTLRKLAPLLALVALLVSIGGTVFDLAYAGWVPRIVTGEEWDRVERGLTQRITALNLFLKDVYGEGKIMADGVIPRRLVLSCKHYRREMRGVRLPHDIYVSIAGIDLVRVPDGSFAVLEDNLRVPSGVSYMLSNRHVMRNVFPKLFQHYHVRSVDHYPRMLLSTLQELSPGRGTEPTVVLLTPGASATPAPT